MKLSMRSLESLGNIVTGDNKLSPYRSGPQLVRLFNEYGTNDIYGQGFPSRWQFAQEKLVALNDTPALGSLIREVIDPREFMDTDFDINAPPYDGDLPKLYKRVASNLNLSPGNPDINGPLIQVLSG